MKRYTFSAFFLNDANRKAFQICRDIAELRPVSPMPIVLLGDRGCGKTHLLYSIVNRVRASSARTGLAYVTARDFPEQVRALAKDASPVERAESAILLVDELDQFNSRIEELETVVRVFLDNSHYVVLASNVHPGRLPNLSLGLKSLIEAGQTVDVRSHRTQASPRPEDPQNHKDAREVIRQQQQEIEHLEKSLAQAQETQSESDSPGVERLRNQLRAERSAKDELARKLEITKAYCESLQQELLSLEEELAKRGPSQAHSETVRQAADISAQAGQEKPRGHGAATQMQQPGPGLSHRQGRDETRVLRARGDTLHGANAALTERIAKLEQELAQKASLQKKVQELESRLETLQDKRNPRQEGLRHEETKQSPLAEPNNAVTQELMVARAQARDALKELEDQRAGSERTRKVLEEALIETREQFEGELRRAKEDMARTSQAKEQALARHRDLEKALAEARNQCAELQNAAGKTAGDTAGLRATLEQAEARNRDLEEALAEAKNQCAELQNAAGKTAGDIAGLRAALEQAEAERTDLRKALSKARIERDGLETSLTQARAQCEEAALAAAAAHTQCDELRATVARAHRENEDLCGQLLRAEGERENLTRSLEELTAARDGLRASLDDAKVTETCLQGQIEQFQRELDAQLEEMEALRRDAASQVAEANAHAGETERRLSTLQQILESSRMTNVVVGAELQTLRDQLKASADVLARLAGHLESSSDVIEGASRQAIGEDVPEDARKALSAACEPRCAAISTMPDDTGPPSEKDEDGLRIGVRSETETRSPSLDEIPGPSESLEPFSGSGPLEAETDRVA